MCVLLVGAMSPDMQAPNATREVVEFIATTAMEDVPTAMLDVTRWLLIDSFACAFAATSLMPEADALMDTVDTLGHGHDSTILGLRRRASPAAAAFVNGGLVHGLNYDALGPAYAHVAAAAVPSTLAAAEASRSTGCELLMSIAIAAEVTCRLTVAANDPLSGRGWLMGQLLAGFGAAAGASRAHGLDTATTASAFGLALMQASGTTQVMADGGAPAKSVYGSFPSLCGVVAAAAAAHGVDASMDVIGGPAGLFAQYLPHGDVDAVTDRLGSRWLALDVRYKRWPNTAVAHPFLEALCQAEFPAGQVRALAFRVGLGRRAFFDPEHTAWVPSSVATAGNSVPYAVACHLARGAFDLDCLTPATFRSPAVRSLLDRTTVEWLEHGPVDEVGLTFRDGSCMTLRVPADEAAADAGTGGALVDKLRQCGRRARNPLAAGDVDQIVDVVMGLQDAADLTELGRALEPGGR
jgi:2-methylcitrate dehydratase PrpD